MHHNEIRDLTANLLTEVCHQVHVEPKLQPVSAPKSFTLSMANIQDGARLDIAVNGFWGVDLNAVMWMSVSLIPMLHPMSIPSLQHTGAMRTLNVVHVANEFKRSNTHSSHHWSFLPQGTWLQRQPPSINDLPPFFLPNGVMNIVWLWNGFTAAFPFLCFAQPSLVCVELDHHWDIFLPLHLH